MPPTIFSVCKQFWDLLIDLLERIQVSFLYRSTYPFDPRKGTKSMEFCNRLFQKIIEIEDGEISLCLKLLRWQISIQCKCTYVLL